MNQPVIFQFLESIDLKWALLVTVAVGIILTLIIKSKIESPIAIRALQIVAFLLIAFDIAVWYSQS